MIHLFLYTFTVGIVYIIVLIHPFLDITLYFMLDIYIFTYSHFLPSILHFIFSYNVSLLGHFCPEGGAVTPHILIGNQKSPTFKKKQKKNRFERFEKRYILKMLLRRIIQQQP